MLKEFADKFVNEEFRERFLHEAMKKPQKLHERICHRLGSLFEAKYLNGAPAFGPEELCIVITDSGPKKMSWSKASHFLGTGDGVLIISESGQKFVAESEVPPAAVKYGAGG